MIVRTALVAVLLVPALGVGAQTTSKSTVIQRIIVKVNGEIFTQTDLEARQVEVLREQNQQVQSPRDLQNEAVLAKALAEVTPMILVDVIDELLLVQRGRELGATFTEANFQETLERIKKQNSFNDDQLKKALAESGMTMNELRQNLERQSLVRHVTQTEIMGGMRVTDQEARTLYKGHPEMFMKPATVMLRELFVEVLVVKQGAQAGFSPSADDAAKAKINEARDRVIKGEDFARVVAEVSESGSKANGGLIGPVIAADVSEELGKLIAKLKPGEVTEPVRTPRGYTLFKLESRAEAAVEPFDKIKDDVIQRIYEDRLDGERKKHLDKLRAQALIEWKDETYRLMYEQAQKTRGK